MITLTTSGKGTDDSSIGFDQARKRRQKEFSKNKKVKGKYHVRIMLQDVVGFAELQERAIYGLGCKLTPIGNKDDDVSNKGPGIDDTRIKIDDFHRDVPHYTPSNPKQGILSENTLSKTTTVIRYHETSVFMKEVNNQNLWNFELGSPESMNVPLWRIVRFQHRGRQDSQGLNTVTFCSLPVTSA